LRKPDLIIYLRASTDTLLSRVKNRDRVFEKSISPEYIHSLNVSYDRWIKKCNDQKVLIIESDGFNVFKDTEKINDIFIQIEKILTK